MPKSRKRSRGGGYRKFLTWLLRNPRKVQAAHALTVVFLLGCLAALVLACYMLLLSRDMPSLSQIENPSFEFASVAYTADGVELARFGRQNRSWISYDDISAHVKNALISTEDHRFESHWGMDMFRTASAFTQSGLGKLGLPFERQGGSTITQQLARNLYNEQIGFAVTVERKLKEMATAVQLERRYSKQEIVEMYLNTVPFRHNAFGIEAAGRTYFGKSAEELDELEAAALIGMLKGTSLYDPVRNPERSRERRNVVLRQMVRRGHLDRQFYETYRDSLTTTRFRSADVTQSFAPYFAEYVRNWVSDWGRENGIDVYGEGLRIHTTLDSGLQQLAQEAVEDQMNGLQAAVDCEWSAQSSPRFIHGEDLEAYLGNPCHTVVANRWAYFWENRQAQLDVFVRETPRFAALARGGTAQNAALEQLKGDAAFMDSLKASKTRLEVGLVSKDPRTGHIRAWVGGRNLAEDWFDHVAIAKRQAGSTFKPFVYTAAIDAGYFPTYTLKDTLINYVDPYTKEVWSPLNSGQMPSGEVLTLREGLSRSLNTISAQLILEIKPSTAALYARRMGIESPLDPVPALALGTSDVSLLELVTGYSTLANLGIRNRPVAILRIEDRRGTVLYEHRPAPGEALSDVTSAVMIDMLRGVINEPYGTGHRIRSQFRLTGYDFAGKTGTTQEGADGWFVLMHPELVTGAWVGFNDRRISFRSSFWGQGAHNALFVAGDYLRRASLASEEFLGKQERFPPPEAFGFLTPAERSRAAEGDGRVKW